jgi:hypothetical protein
VKGTEADHRMTYGHGVSLVIKGWATPGIVPVSWGILSMRIDERKKLVDGRRLLTMTWSCGL